MTNKIKGLTVALTHDLHEDDCQKIIDSIKMIKGVEGVEMHVSDLMSYIARQQVKGELRSKLSGWLNKL